MVGRTPSGVPFGPAGPLAGFSVNGKDLLLQEKSGTGASGCPLGRDQGVRPTESVQNPWYEKTMRH